VAQARIITKRRSYERNSLACYQAPATGYEVRWNTCNKSKGASIADPRLYPPQVLCQSLLLNRRTGDGSRCAISGVANHGGSIRVEILNSRGARLGRRSKQGIAQSTATG
jgi:hypothetical protein